MSSATPVLPVVIGVTGGLVFLVALVLGILLTQRWRHQRALDREQGPLPEFKLRTEPSRSTLQPYSFHAENTYAPSSAPPSAPRFMVTSPSPAPQQTAFPLKSKSKEDKRERPTSALSYATTASFYPTSVMLSRTPDEAPALPIHSVVQKTFDPNERVFK